MDKAGALQGSGIIAKGSFPRKKISRDGYDELR
jgi:hypothetical protein